MKALQFHIAVISAMAFLTLAVYAYQSCALDPTFPAPLPKLETKIHMSDKQGANALLYAFNVGR